MASSQENSNINAWQLDSGLWEQNSNTKGFEWKKNSSSRSISNLLTSSELQKWMGLPTHPQNPNLLYPPEFSFCPETGEKLKTTSITGQETWISPIGLTPLPERKAGVVRGLNQSEFPLEITHLLNRQEVDDAEFVLPLPPSGDYQFFSIQAGTLDNVLIALDPANGALFVYLPDQEEWHVLEHEQHFLLAGTELAGSSWRCESQQLEKQTRLYLPTDHGLALLTVDVTSLSFDVEYVGEGQCIAAPIFYLDAVWQPIRNSAGEIELLGYSYSNQTIQKMALSNSQGLQLTQLQAPISTNRYLAWLCRQGQLILERTVKGLELKFLAWSDTVQPVFNMGCPYLSADGAIYQLCSDTKQDHNLYIQINTPSFGSYPSETPRVCSGSFNFHLANKYKSAPWLSPEIVIESATNAEVVRVVVPLLESLSTGNVLGLRFELSGTQSVASLLESQERERAVLVLDDSNAQTALFSLTVPEPWRMRFFTHQHILWAYHPEMKNIVGWSLSV